MAKDKAGGIYLLVDVGRVLTHAAYVATVEGSARLVAVAEASTTSTGGGGLLEGVRRATGNLELLVGRQVLDSSGGLRRPADADGRGVDGAVVTTSLAPPLQVALVGLSRDLSLASAARAATLPYVTLVRTVSLEASVRRWETEDLQALIDNPPDVVVLVGGVDGGPVAPIRDMGETLGAAYSLLPEGTRPVAIYAGNERAHRPLVAAFSGVTDLRLVANVRPTAQSENLGELRAALSRLFYQQSLGRPEDLQALGQWAGTGPMYDPDAMARTLRFMARRHGLTRGVLGVDVGGTGSRVLRVRPEGAALIWTEPYGTGAGLAALRELGDPTAVVRWMHHPLSWAEAWDRLSNVEVRPAGIPQSDEDWDLQQAAVREALQRSWMAALSAWSGLAANGQTAGEYDVVVARGTAFSHARTPGQAALMLIDALQPYGLLRLALDWADLLPGLAGLATQDAQAAVQVFDSDALMELGALIAVRGLGKATAEALRARLLVQGELRTELTVPPGSIRRLPLGVNELGRLELYPARGVDLGIARPGRGVVAEVRGGELGVIVDARGRPLALPIDDDERCRALETWQREIDEA